MSITRKSKCQLRKRLQNYIIGLPGYEKSQIRYCGYRNDVPFEAHLKIHQDQLGGIHRCVYFTGFQTCGSIFCPVCSGLIKTYRANELNTFCKAWSGSIYFLTFTISHGKTDRLEKVFSVLKKAYRNFFWNDASKRIFGHVDGTVRCFEVTRTTNGWHPHYHVLLFVPGVVSFSDEAVSKLQEIWVRTVNRAGGKADSEIGFSIQRGDKAGSYICKLGSELQGQECKDSCDFLQLLVDRKKGLVQEYLTVLKGVKWLKWSKGLRSQVSLPEVTDSQIIQDGMFGFNNQKLRISQLMLNFLEDVFFQRDLDGSGRDLLAEYLKNHFNDKMFQHGPDFKRSFEAYCNLNLAKNSKLSDPDPEQFYRDMLRLGIFEKYYFD